MMNKFMEELKKELIAKLDGVVIEDREVVKMNDEVLHGLSFKRDGIDAGPVFYCENLYNSHMDGESIEEIVEMIADSINVDAFPDVVKANGLLDNYESKLGFRLLEAERNVRFLNGVPHKPVGAGLEVVLTIVNGDYQTVVTNSLVEHLDADVEDMFISATRNTMHDAVLRTMFDATFGGNQNNIFTAKELPNSIEEPCVLSNKSGVFGAVPFAYAEIRETIASYLGEFYALPSSVHEMICVPVSFGISAKDLVETVKGANKSVVQPKDILSDHVYYVDLNGKVKVVA